MITRFNIWFWGTFLGPLNKRRFRLRIWLRVRWLACKLWCKHIRWRQFRNFFIRPALLLLVAIGLPIFILLNHAWFLPELDLPADLTLPPEVDWRAIAQPTLILVGVPAAFVLWMFRDANAQANLENSRKDVNLKEFQEIQMRAAGAMDEKLPAGSRETLQIAATHQLAGFLSGEFGDSFRRPAWELLRARLMASSERIGYRAIADYVEKWHRLGDDDRLAPTQLSSEILMAISKVNKDNVGQAQRDVLRDKWPEVFRKGLPLTDTCFDGISLPTDALFASCNFSRCTFLGARLSGAHFELARFSLAHLEGASLTSALLECADLNSANLEGVQLSWAHLECANLSLAHLEGANLSCAHLEGAKLNWADLKEADLSWSHLNGAELNSVNLEGARLHGAHMEGADLSRAILKRAKMSSIHIDESTRLANALFDDDTHFDFYWENLTSGQKEAERQKWRDLGMVHVDDTFRWPLPCD